jgi:hypothetical protein
MKKYTALAPRAVAVARLTCTFHACIFYYYFMKYKKYYKDSFQVLVYVQNVFEVP